jgi:hypothetical protein
MGTLQTLVVGGEELKISVEEIENYDYYQTHSLGARILIEGPEVSLSLSLNTHQVKEIIGGLVDSL